MIHFTMKKLAVKCYNHYMNADKKDDRESRSKAYRRRTGEQCGNYKMHGMDVCRMHGGKSLRGAKSPRAKTLKYSKYVPDKLLLKLAQAETDDELIEMRAEMALLDTRIMQLLERLETDEAGKRWKAAQEAYREVDKHWRLHDRVNVEISLERLKEAIIDGRSDYEAWEDIQNVIRLRRQLAQTQHKRETEMGQLVTIAQALNLVTRVFGIVTEVWSGDPKLDVFKQRVRAVLGTKEAAVLLKNKQEEYSDINLISG